VFDAPDLRSAYEAVFGPTVWDQDAKFDQASSECEAPEPRQHPRYDDPDHAAMYALRDEVSSA
jgi:hypothetical protein